MVKLTLHIEGMHCGSCAVGIQMLTSEMEGVETAEVSHEGKTGIFDIDPTKVTKEALVKAIAELGYTATEPA